MVNILARSLVHMIQLDGVRRYLSQIPYHNDLLRNRPIHNSAQVTDIILDSGQLVLMKHATHPVSR